MKYLTLLLALCLLGCASNTQVIEGELGGLTFIDAQHGWAVGGAKEKKVFVASTADGGAHWETTLMPTEHITPLLTGVAFPDSQHGWVMGSHGQAYETRDGGKNWAKIRPPGDAVGMDYRDGLVCVVLGPPGYAHIDGFSTGPAEEFPNGVLLKQNRTGRLFHPFGVQIIDSQHLVGYGSGELYVSNDKGHSWSVVELEEYRADVRGAYFLTPERGWIALKDGRLLVAQDGGARRELITPVGLEGRSIERLHFWDESQGVALVTSREKALVMGVS